MSNDEEGSGRTLTSTALLNGLMQSNVATVAPGQLSSLQESQLYNFVGQNCDVLDAVCINLRAVVLELRSRDKTLNNPDDFDQAVEWIAAGYRVRPNLEVLRRYARALNSFLRMPPNKIPDKPILTGSLPQWFGKGDEVAVYVRNGSRSEWWHAVVIKDVAKGC